MLFKRATQRTLFGMALVGTFVLCEYGCAHAQLFTTPQTVQPYQLNIPLAQPRPVEQQAPVIIIQPQLPQPQPPITLDIYGPHPRYEQ
jgi:hypothetical protein